MRHHFGDFLDRDGGYWTTMPNRDRYAYRIGDVPGGSKEVTMVTIGKEDENWSRALTLPNLEELTLHDPTQEQLAAIGELHSLRRLRITHARPRSIEFIESMRGVEELVLEYVSGFGDLTPLRKVKHLRALHMENLRGVSNFYGLSGIDSLRYLAIYGTLDWKQPIEDFEFLRGISKLEVLALWQIISKKAYPAMLPAVSLRCLKKLKLHGSYLATEEYALLEEILQGIEGAAWGPFRTVAYSRMTLPSTDIRTQLSEEVIRTSFPEVIIRFDGKREIDDPDSRYIEFTGKGAGRIKYSSPKAEQRCTEFGERYDAMKQAARILIDQQRLS
jgi:hypothetical protein